MSKIDVSDWKEFKVGDLINFDSSAKIYHAEHLDILDKPEDLTYYPYVVRTAFNNGIKGYIKEDPNTLNPANTISFAQDTAQLFYQDTPYFTGNKIKICTIKDHDLTKNIALFLISVLLNGFDTFSYDSSFNVATLSRVNIKLPVTSTGEPDWDYMDEYIEKLATQARKNVSSLATLNPVEHKIDIKAWKEFKVGELFYVRPSKYVKQNGKTLINAELFDNGDHKVIVNTSTNNGIGGYTSQDFTEDGNVITFSDTTDGPSTMFYQDQPFVGYSHVKVMEPIDNIKNSRNVLLYLTATIRKALSLNDYNFTNKLTTQAMNNTSIKLPVTSTGEPDWDYMEKYIDSVQNKARKSLELLKQI